METFTNTSDSLFTFLMDFIFGSMAKLFNIFYTSFRNFLFNYSDGFRDIGSDFMGNTFQKFDNVEFDLFSYIYFAIGIFIVIWTIKTAIIPTILTIFEALIDAIDAITPFT